MQKNKVDALTNFFRSSWSVYDTIIQRNYMFHREIEQAIREVIGARSVLGPYSLLDLGCGNTRGLARTLRQFPPVRYLGIDMSSAALAEASHELAALPDVELREQDMVQCVTQLAVGSFDLIYSGFALHHFSTSEKAQLIQTIGAVRSPGGEFLLVDVVRETEETREHYLEGYIKMIETQWTDLGAEGIDQIRQHVRLYDYPETGEELAAMVNAAGFTEMRLLARHRQHQVLLCS